MIRLPTSSTTAPPARTRSASCTIEASTTSSWSIRHIPRTMRQSPSASCTPPSAPSSTSATVTILGVVFVLRLILDCKAMVAPEPGRIEDLTAEIDGIFENTVLSASHAARIVGKADFAAHTLFGKVGRACLAPTRARLYQIGGSAKVEQHRPVVVLAGRHARRKPSPHHGHLRPQKLARCCAHRALQRWATSGSRRQQ